MKKNYTVVLWVSLLSLALYSCSENKNTGYSSPGINIPATTGVMINYEESLKMRRITNAERKELAIDVIELDEIKKYPNRDIVKGKEIYRGEAGRLVTFLIIEEDYAVSEYLAGYGSSGQMIGCIRIGINVLYAGDYGIGKIDGNIVKCTFRWSEPEEWGEGIDQIYTITDDLQFIPFRFPPSSFPCEIPFMTHESSDLFDETNEGATLYCNIESIVCTGKSGNKYTFVIKGKSKQDSKGLKRTDRSFLLEPLGKGAASAGEVIKVVMPVVGENITFEIKAKSRVDENMFTWLKVKRVDEAKPLMSSKAGNDSYMPVIDDIKNFFRVKVGEVALVWIVLLLSIILFVMRISKKENETRQGASYTISNTLFLTVCAIEIIHFASIEDMIWFCVPDRVGWIWTIVNFFLLGGIVYNQILYFFDVLGDVLTKGTGCDIRFGLYSWVGSIACALLCGFFFRAGIIWVLLLLCILQLVQSILIFRSFAPNLKGAFFAVFVYLLGTTGTILTALTFISILIIVVVALVFLWLVLKFIDFGSGSKRRKGTAYYSDGTSEEVEETGRGILGERYYKGKDSGNEFVE